LRFLLVVEFSEEICDFFAEVGEILARCGVGDVGIGIFLVLVLVLVLRGLDVVFYFLTCLFRHGVFGVVEPF